ncbi:hypothetical protein VNI00_016234 [Paramarasmius palmivorus]|uniref:Prolactin receptor n=1 Tax=Paramarasmius palmivorus TaxID=297713 RepID=A0AAW0BFC9_9AGAR
MSNLLDSTKQFADKPLSPKDSTSPPRDDEKSNKHTTDTQALDPSTICLFRESMEAAKGEQKPNASK